MKATNAFNGFEEIAENEWHCFPPFSNAGCLEAPAWGSTTSSIISSLPDLASMTSGRRRAEALLVFLISVRQSATQRTRSLSELEWYYSHFNVNEKNFILLSC
jgi:hypothetical protein